MSFIRSASKWLLIFLLQLSGKVVSQREFGFKVVQGHQRAKGHNHLVFYIHRNGNISTLIKIPDFDLMALIFHKATDLDPDEGQMGLEVDISLFECDKTNALEHMT